MDHFSMASEYVTVSHPFSRAVSIFTTYHVTKGDLVAIAIRRLQMGEISYVRIQATY